MLSNIDWDALSERYLTAEPFRHVVIDGFFKDEIAEKLSMEFPKIDDPIWFVYNNAIENKKSLNSWEAFPSFTYRALSYLNSLTFLDSLGKLTRLAGLETDIGLNGGGWHSHGRGGKLNVHLDYSIHPKLLKERRLNLIVYLTKEWEPAWGGGLELWSHNAETNAPLKREKYVEFKFNRAILFDTTQNSWHGLPEEIGCPEGISRQSIATYYLTEPREKVDPRGKALFAPTENQKEDQEVLDLIKRRSQVHSASSMYRKK